jgi:uncharacterized protein YcsI (UPF0317 family)
MKKQISFLALCSFSFTELLALTTAEYVLKTLQQSANPNYRTSKTAGRFSS